MSSTAPRPSQTSRTGKSSVKPSRRGGDGSKNARSTMGSKSGIGKQGIPEHGTVAPVVIRDEFGHDVTPRSLLPPAQATVTKASGADQSGSESQSSAFESAFGKGGAGMSSLGSESEVAARTQLPRPRPRPRPRPDPSP